MGPPSPHYLPPAGFDTTAGADAAADTAAADNTAAAAAGAGHATPRSPTQEPHHHDVRLSARTLRGYA